MLKKNDNKDDKPSRTVFSYLGRFYATHL